MKLKTSFRLLFSLVLTFSFFIRPGSVIALEDYDPTKNYTVHSVPVISDESKATIISGNDIEQTDQSSIVPFQTAKDIQNTPSNVEIAKTFVVNFITHQGRELGIIFITFSLTSAMSFLLFRRVMKSALNSQIRVVGLVSAIVLSATTGVALMTAYNQQISFFEQVSGWQFSPLGEDIFIVGGVLFTCFLFLAGPTLLFGVKSLSTVAPVFIPDWKKILTYFTKETKSAFTETEKECQDTIEKCSSLFDKTIILIFNYLPGNMPDLGMDDAIINFKNNLFKTPQPQRAN